MHPKRSWHQLCRARLDPQQVHHIDLPFTEKEVEKNIKPLLKQKASGPDGYIGTFFKACWNTIKGDCMAALQQLYSMNQQDLYFLNQILVVLVPERILDFRPISLIHSFAKLVSKLLANRLARIWKLDISKAFDTINWS
jgi:hypothetical protein